jgi:hypothetical protein
MMQVHSLHALTTRKSSVRKEQKFDEKAETLLLLLLQERGFW